MTATRRARTPKATTRGPTEAQFQAAVIEYASLRGWMHFHAYDSRRSEPGFPDLVLARGGSLIFAELKTATGRVSAAQRAWLNRLSNVIGVYACLWRPSDWPTIEQVLV